jgi:xanthine dehydrogenase accessory factor
MTIVTAGDDSRVNAQGRWLRALNDSWPRTVCRLLEAGEPVVIRALIAEVRGSAPREPGACMLVSQGGTYGTIGGGNLEWQAMRVAQSLLASGTRSVQIRRLVLGRELSQCCGGVVQLWLERFTAEDLSMLRQAAHADSRVTAIVTETSNRGVARKLLRHSGIPPRLRFSSTSEDSATLLEPINADRAPLWLYGAGHVAQALIRLLGELPFEVTWIDSRAELLPAPLWDNVHPLCASAPTNTVGSAPAGARFLVMTHDHALDYALCRKILERNDFAWLGLIGSKSKGARFRSRLARDGVAPETIARLVCPIGVEGVNSKWPAAIAVAVAGQLLQGLESPAPSGGPGLATGSRAPAEAAGPSASGSATAVDSHAAGAATAEGSHGSAAAADLHAAAASAAPVNACTSADCAACRTATRSIEP